MLSFKRCSLSSKPQRLWEDGSLEDCRREAPQEGCLVMGSFGVWIICGWFSRGCDRAFVLKSHSSGCAELACQWDTVTIHSILSNSFPEPSSEVLLRKLQGTRPPEMSPPNLEFEKEEILLPVLGSDTKGRACTISQKGC